METETTEIVPTPTLNGAPMKPADMVAAAQERAEVVANIIRRQGLAKRISGKEYVQVEGWCTLAAQYSLVPSVQWSKPLETGGFEAQAELRRMDNGAVVATAQAECGTYGDGPWMERAAYAQRSMAETRAVSKVCRVALSWVMVLAGYEVTPAEEVPDGGFDDRPRQSGGTIKAAEGERKMKAKYKGECYLCGNAINVGDGMIFMLSNKKAKHDPPCMEEPPVIEAEPVE